MDKWTLFFGFLAACGLPFAIWAVRISLRSERRDLEIRDVVWARQEAGDQWGFVHSGSVPVSDVKIVFTVDGKTTVTKVDMVPTGVPVITPNPEHDRSKELAAADQRRYEREQAEQDEIRERSQSDRWLDAVNGVTPALAFPRTVIPPMGVPSELSAFITWRYPSGVPDVQELSWVERYF